MIIDLQTLDWVAISAIITLLMAIATFCSLWQNRKQLNELKRQWEEVHKPHVIAVLCRYSSKCYVVIKNISNNYAYCINVNLSIHCIEDKYYNYEIKDKIKEVSFNLEPNGKKEFLLLLQYWPEKHYDGYIDIQLSYNKKFYDEITLHLSELNIIEDAISNENAIAEKINRLTSVIETKRFL